MTKLYTRPIRMSRIDMILAGIPYTEFDRRKALAKRLPMKERITRYYTTAAEDAQYDRDSLAAYNFHIETRDWQRDVGRR